MKLSILTATYNRAGFLEKLYNSIIQNMDSGLDVEWLIMDDGSEDDTLSVVQKFINEQKIEIKYNTQENQGKMAAINNLMKFVTGDLIVDCDSDDYFKPNAFKIIKEEFEKTEKKDLYGICFLKQKENGEIDGTSFKNSISTMFDLYFKENITGEKNIVYYADIRKEYKHELEHNEKFITEARMYHKIDEKYDQLLHGKKPNEVLSDINNVSATHAKMANENIKELLKYNTDGYLDGQRYLAYIDNLKNNGVITEENKDSVESKFDELYSRNLTFKECMEKLPENIKNAKNGY